MKKYFVIGGIIIAVVLIMSFVVYASGNNKTKAMKETVAVEDAGEHNCADCPIDCLENHPKGECTEHEPGSAECIAKHASGSCGDHQPGSVECKEKQAVCECSGH